MLGVEPARAEGPASVFNGLVKQQRHPYFAPAGFARMALRIRHRHRFARAARRHFSKAFPLVSRALLRFAFRGGPNANS